MRFAGATIAKVSVRGFGHVHLRFGQSDLAVVRQIFREREYETETFTEAHKRILKQYLQILGSGRLPIIVDAGANIGAATIWFSSKYPKAKVIAIEPDKKNLEILRLNCDRDGPISIVAAGVGAKSGYAKIHEGALGWATKVERSNDGVPIVSMDEVFAMTEGGIPFIAKIDIEGFESDLFSSDLDWLDVVYAVIIEPHDWMLPGKMTSRSFQSAMANREFEIFIRGENLIYIRT